MMSIRPQMLRSMALALALWLAGLTVVSAGSQSFGVRVQLRSAVRIDDPANPVRHDPAVVMRTPSNASGPADARISVSVAGSDTSTVEVFQVGGQEQTESAAGSMTMLTILMQ